MEPSFDHWTIVFLAVALQGLVLAVALLRQKSKPIFYLSGVVSAFSLILIYYVIYWTGYHTVLPRAIAVVQGLTYCLGPLFYHYILSRHNRASIHPLHWAPFVAYVSCFFTVPWLLAEVRPLVVQTQVVFQNIHLLAYAALAIVASVKSSKWKLYLSLSYLGYVMSFLAYFIMVWTGRLTLEFDYFVSVAAAVCIYYIGYSALVYRTMLTDHARYDKSGLSDSAAKALRKEILNYMNEEKPFLESDLKLNDLALALSFSPNHVSQVINEREGCNFSDFVNRYRVEESKRLLQKDLDSTLIQIAYRAGFNNKVTFNNAFKKSTGLLPSEFRTAVITQTPELQ